MRNPATLLAVAATALLIAACTATSTATTEALLAAATTTSAPTSSPSPATTSGVPLVESGCDVFDADELGQMTPIAKPLQLVEATSTNEELTCNFVRAGDGLDAGVRIEVDLLAAHPDGHFTTAGQLESPLTVAAKQGVGTGRGTLRVQLDEARGMTLAVTIRAIGSAGVIPRDGEYLDIRDAIAAYVIGALN